MRLIDADELSMSKFHPVPYTHITPKDADAESYEWGWNDAVDAIMSEAPTIDPVKHGRWKKQWHSGLHRELPACSECGQFVAFRTFYCPNCGAKMDERGAYGS